MKGLATTVAVALLVILWLTFQAASEVLTAVGAA